MTRPRQRMAILAGLALLTLAACATQPYVERAGTPGFLMGLVHGFIAWFALIVHIFNPQLRVYAFPNTGGWYDFGFLLGLSIMGGGGGAAARR
ncbi:MAG: hypothetical protein JWM33_2829 [Caulobacteraceae bacterium]|nr:hypothetical protein [Caulobacteraceae bacterium]